MHVRDPLFQHLPTRKETAVVYQQQIAVSLLVVSLSFPLFDKVCLSSYDGYLLLMFDVVVHILFLDLACHLRYFSFTNTLSIR